MKRFSDKIRPFSLSLAFLMPVIFNSALLAEVVPEVLVGEGEEKSSLDDDIKQLKKEAEEAEALHNTQKEFRNSDIEGYRHPYYWAAFQLSGDWRPIDF